MHRLRLVEYPLCEVLVCWKQIGDKLGGYYKEEGKIGCKLGSYEKEIDVMLLKDDGMKGSGVGESVVS